MVVTTILLVIIVNFLEIIKAVEVSKRMKHVVPVVVERLRTTRLLLHHLLSFNPVILQCHAPLPQRLYVIQQGLLYHALLPQRLYVIQQGLLYHSLLPPHQSVILHCLLLHHPLSTTLAGTAQPNSLTGTPETGGIVNSLMVTLLKDACTMTCTMSAQLHAAQTVHLPITQIHFALKALTEIVIGLEERH